MDKKYFIALFTFLLIISCSKKRQPQTADNVGANNTEKPAAKKVIVRKFYTPVPKLLIMDDKGARRTVDGRLYHDLEGNRYWKNFKDGKYYLFNKAMYSDSAFKPH